MSSLPHMTGREQPSAGAATFPRTMHLKHRRLIRPLFDRSCSDVGTVAVGCVRLLYRILPREQMPCQTPLQVGFAPGRTQKAVQRNRIRRLLREVYRMHQSALVDLFAHRPDALTLMILYRGVVEDPSPVHQDLPRALDRLAGRIATTEVSDP